MASLAHTLFYFIMALAILIACHEFGHFWVARKCGVKVIRFSLGFGRPLWRYQKQPGSTEFTISVFPLGGYVKMVDEREGPVATVDLPFAFNRQSLAKRSSIVFAGPLFNFLLAVLFTWIVLVVGESGVRPVLGPVEAESLAARAGFVEGDEIVAVGGDPVVTWTQAMAKLFEQVLDVKSVAVAVVTAQGDQAVRMLTIPETVAAQPDRLYKELGFKPWEPRLPAVIDRIEPGGAAEAAGLLPGDLIVSVNGEPIPEWRHWVDYVRNHPATRIQITIEREGVRMPLEITPTPVDTADGVIGRIGAAARVPEDVAQSMTVEYRLGVLPAVGAAFARTVDHSLLTLKMAGRMLIGKAGVENLSGPISIAQYAGQSARLGFTQFLKFLAIVSISLAVLNLLPIPVLDGGHLMFYLIEWIKGSPVSEQAQLICQQVGMFILLCLMSLAFILDIERLLT